MALRPDFVISDTHWLHRNIIKYQNRPMDHDALMLKRWRTTVKDTHTILHLGDLFFGKPGGEQYERFATEIAPELTGTRYLLLGNHDRATIDYAALGFTVLKPYSIDYRDFEVSFDHYPKILHPGMRRIHLHGHIHGSGYGPDGDPERASNINCSVEVIDYRPQKFTSLVDAAILARKDGKGGGRYYNSASFRQSQTDRQRRAA